MNARQTAQTVATQSAGRMSRRVLLALAPALLMSWQAAGQAPETPPPPGLELSPAQRQLIYTSISSQTHKRTAAPPTFASAVGATVPVEVELEPLPDTIVQVIPQTRGYLHAFIANQVMIVDARSRRVVEVITRT